MPPSSPVSSSPDADHVFFRNAMRVLAVVGLILPWFYNLRYFAGGGSVAPSVFWADAAANELTTAITLDVYLSAVAFSA